MAASIISMFKVPEKFRIKAGPMGSNSSYGNNGQFMVKSLRLKQVLLCQASDGGGWEHVSISVPSSKNCPTWDQMCFIKNLFWSSDALVVQFHPPQADYVNFKNNCLHLWRELDNNNFCARPPNAFV